MSSLVIKSRNSTVFKKFKKLYSTKGFRFEEGKTILDGPHLINTCHESGGKVEEFIVDASVQTDENKKLLANHPEKKIHVLSHELFCAISDLHSVTGLMAIIDIPKFSPYKNDNGFHLLLDDIQDPGNLGAILRTHAAAGNKLVFLSKGCCDLWSPKVIRGSQGAQFVLTCYQQQDLASLIDGFNFSTFCLGMKGESVLRRKLEKNVAFVLGNEGRGINPMLLEKSDQMLSIPMTNKIESLNVGVAASIIIYEYARQFLFQKSA